MNTLGDRLKIARQKKGLKQTEVMKRANINNKTLSGYENNVSDPDTNTLTVLAELYEVSFKWLMTGEGNMKENNSSSLPKVEKDIAKRLEQVRNELENSDGLAFDGEPMSEEAKESLLESMELIFRQTQRINKKFTPKKYRED